MIGLKNHSEYIEFHGKKVQLTRRSYQKRIRLSVHTSGMIKVSANQRTSKKTIVEFLESQKTWLVKSIGEVEQIKSRYPDKKFVTGEEYPYLGSSYHLEIKQDLVIKIKFENQKLNFFIPENEECLTPEKRQKYIQFLKKSYRSVASQLMLKRLEFFSEKMQLKPLSVHFRGQKSIWGSCTPENKINLNYKLIVAPLEVIDYVIIHELAHIRFKNHSKSFWQLVEQYTEHRQFSRNWLRDHQHRSHFL